MLCIDSNFMQGKIERTQLHMSYYLSKLFFLFFDGGGGILKPLIVSNESQQVSSLIDCDAMWKDTKATVCHWVLFWNGQTGLYGRQVDAIGWVGALVPRVHLGGIHTLLVPVHLRGREESARVRCRGGVRVDHLAATLTISELNGFTLMFRMELLVRDHTLVLCLKAALTYNSG